MDNLWTSRSTRPVPRQIWKVVLNEHKLLFFSTQSCSLVKYHFFFSIFEARHDIAVTRKRSLSAKRCLALAFENSSRGAADSLAKYYEPSLAGNFDKRPPHSLGWKFLKKKLAGETQFFRTRCKVAIGWHEPFFFFPVFFFSLWNRPVII